MTPIVHTSQADRIVTITIDRAPVNALAPEDWRALEEAIRVTADDLDVRIIVLAGGEGRFCAGADIQSLLAQNDEPALMLRVVADVCQAIRTCRVPVVAAIDGPAHGGGLELALACDLRIASPRATFSASGVNMGLVASVQSLVTAVGDTRARHMLLTGAKVDGATAESWALVTQLADDPNVAARSLAEGVAAKAPLSIEANKSALASARHLDANEHGEMMTKLFTELAGTDDHYEAIRAFLEKRGPTFTRR